MVLRYQERRNALEKVRGHDPDVETFVRCHFTYSTIREIAPCKRFHAGVTFADVFQNVSPLLVPPPAMKHSVAVDDPATAKRSGKTTRKLSGGGRVSFHSPTTAKRFWLTGECVAAVTPNSCCVVQVGFSPRWQKSSGFQEYILLSFSGGGAADPRRRNVSHFTPAAKRFSPPRVAILKTANVSPSRVSTTGASSLGSGLSTDRKTFRRYGHLGENTRRRNISGKCANAAQNY